MIVRYEVRISLPIDRSKLLGLRTHRVSHTHTPRGALSFPKPKSLFSFFQAAAPTRLVAALAARVAGPDGEIPGLTVTRPSLEDTYLRLIGAAPDGAGPEKETS